MEGYLILSDGTIYQGISFGAETDQITEGEVVFNTGLTGFQELLTDPSYCGQIVTLTYPLVGNYGINTVDNESDRIQVKALVVRGAAHKPNHWQLAMSLPEFLKSQHIIGLEGIDTRALTRKIRNHGTMNGVICTGFRSEEELQVLVNKARETQGWEGQDLTALVSTSTPYVIHYSSVHGQIEDPFLEADLVESITPEYMESLDKLTSQGIYRVVVIDYGVKRNILRSLFALGCEVVVVPKHFSATEILEFKPSGILLSNGPGDPKDVVGAQETVQELIQQGIPLLGICLGHQILALALGGDTVKLKFGHRGGNHPVKNPEENKVYITSQNHGYVVVKDSLEPETFEIIAVNANDGTIEGFKHKTLPIMSIQYHPEGNPGPDDTGYHFGEFFQAMHKYYSEQI